MFITRMPETLSIAKGLLQQVKVAAIYRIDDNYRYQEVCAVVYGEIRQGLIIVYSQKAYERDLGTLNRQALRGSESEGF